MATNAFARRLVAVGVCASLGVFTMAAIAGPAFAKSKGKGKKHSTTTTTKKKSSSKKKKTKTTTKGTTTVLSTEVKKIETSEKGQKQATFIATYSLKTSGGTQAITFAQEPPKSLFKTTSGAILDNGTTTFYCSTTSTSTSGSTATTCIKSTQADPLGGIFDLFSGTAALQFFNSAEEEGVAKAAGVTVKYSTKTVAGLPSKCLSVSTGSTTEVEYCVANIGLLDYWTASGSSATLTKYSSSVPSGTFTPPAGANIVDETAS